MRDSAELSHYLGLDPSIKRRMDEEREAQKLSGLPPGDLCVSLRRGGRGTNLPFLLTSIFSQPMTIQWLMAARKIGKHLASLEPPILSQLGNKTHDVICGVAGCVVKRKKLRRITE